MWARQVAAAKPKASKELEGKKARLVESAGSSKARARKHTSLDGILEDTKLPVRSSGQSERAKLLSLRLLATIYQSINWLAPAADSG